MFRFLQSRAHSFQWQRQGSVQIVCESIIETRVESENSFQCKHYFSNVVSTANILFSNICFVKFIFRLSSWILECLKIVIWDENTFNRETGSLTKFFFFGLYYIRWHCFLYRIRWHCFLQIPRTNHERDSSFWHHGSECLEMFRFLACHEHLLLPSVGQKQSWTQQGTYSEVFASFNINL